ncbi:hypothetical protein [Autumnicola psychrophila]|uniref:Phosphatidate cytidylyltransferase n=1 Tax=Autumnicola psychrophila TaxID=3075592 RepID=A0ABU3DQH4_9FLAO|nr:hypothetical protein [Zunongwangia sp. F225]MDT0685961.1 hypothetical protein [Zunongwangia sp. F225]
MIKIARRIAFFLFILLHFSFLLVIFYESTNTFLLIGLLLIISFSISIAYFKAPREEEEHFFEDLYNIVFVVIGCIITFFLNQKIQLGPVLAAGLTGTVASFIPNFFRRKKNFIKEIPAAIYCGAFLGMTGPAVTENWKFILLAAFITGVFYISSKNIFQGYGGKLGSVAFGGVAITSTFLFLISEWNL